MQILHRGIEKSRKNGKLNSLNALIAQLVEHPPLKRRVVGSNPTGRTRQIKSPFCICKKGIF